MNILFDNSVPWGISRFLEGHTVKSAKKMGWATLENGNLLTAAELGGFDVLITSDQNLPYQQSFTTRRIAVLILSTNHWPTIERVVARVSSAIDFLQASQVVRLEIED
jgi:hypothetical protein